MAYLFWAFAVVWIGLFLYLAALARRGRALEDEIARLRGDGAAVRGKDG